MAKAEVTPEDGKARFPMRVKRGFATVTIYRRPHARTASGFVYTVAWTVGGHRTLLQRATLQAAQIEAVMKAEQLAAGRVDCASLTTDDAGTLRRAQEICGKVPIVSALEEWAAARKLTGGAILTAARAWADKHAAAKPVSVPEAVKEFLKEKKARGVDVTASYDHFLPRLADAFSGPLASLSASVLENWIATTFAAGNKTVHPATFNTARKRLVTLWRWARVKRYLPQDSLTEAERIGSAKEPAKRREIISVEDFARVLLMLQSEHPDHLAAAVLAGFCGLRREEVHAQRWSDVNLKAGKLAVSAVKEGTPSERLVEITAAAVEWLRLCDQSGELVAPSWAQDRIRAFCRAAVPPIPAPDNAFRHSFVSYRVASSGSVSETALEAGNSSAVIYKNYRRPVTKEDGQAWFALTPAVAHALVKSE